MKHVKDFGDFRLNEGAVKELLFSIVEQAVETADSWLWNGSSVSEFLNSSDKFDFVWNRFDKFVTEIFSNNASGNERAFIEENENSIIEEIVNRIEDDISNSH
jgi:hypothetical protein